MSEHIGGEHRIHQTPDSRDVLESDQEDTHSWSIVDVHAEIPQIMKLCNSRPGWSSCRTKFKEHTRMDQTSEICYCWTKRMHVVGPQWMSTERYTRQWR
jgi:hypothetical protein